jgi:protein-arginine kinase activator protein McsA
MTQDEIIEMARQAGFVEYELDDGTTNAFDKRYEAFAKLVAAKAIAGLESQERNFCPRCGKRTNDIHTCTPPQRTEQEPVKLPCCGYTDASAVKWNPFNRVVQCHNCGQTYTQPQRSESSGKPSAWVGLTNEELTDLFYNTNLGQQSAVSQAVALLKERNS